MCMKQYPSVLGLRCVDSLRCIALSSGTVQIGGSGKRRLCGSDVGTFAISDPARRSASTCISAK